MKESFHLEKMFLIPKRGGMDISAARERKEEGFDREGIGGKESACQAPCSHQRQGKPMF